jgi:hypothetical protein
LQRGLTFSNRSHIIETMKEKNTSAVLLGKLSAKSRFKGMDKQARKDQMKKLWLKSIEVRKANAHLTNK